MGSMTMSADGLEALKKEERPIDGLYDDPKGYATFGVGHLMHKTDKWGSFLLAAAQANDAWKAKLLTDVVSHVSYFPRTAFAGDDLKAVKEKAVELGQEVVAKKRGKDFAKLNESEKASMKAVAQNAVGDEQIVLCKTPSSVLQADLKDFEDSVNSNVTGVTLTQAEFDALVSLAFNIGTPNFEGSTLLKRINENKYRAGEDVKAREAAITEIETQFGAWNKSGGAVLDGLTKRRAREAAMFLKGARDELVLLKLKQPAASPKK